MKRTMLVGTVFLFALMLPGVADTIAVAKKAGKVENAAPGIPLNADGERLLAKYSALLKTLQAQIGNALPKIDEQKLAAFQKARDATRAAEPEASAQQAALGKIQAAKALVEHAKGKWIGGADKGIAQAQAALQKATTDAQREAAQKDLAKWQANKEDGIKALKERQAALDKAQLDAPQLAQTDQAAKAALARAQSNELMAATSLLDDLKPLLASDKLDAPLVQATVLAEATPRGLAQFAQQGKEQEALVEKLLGDDALLKQMLVAGGAAGGQYGRAMEIYTAIQQASPKAGAGLFQRLALGVSLEHAVPIKQSNAPSATNAPAIVDPVNRYLHYEKACLNGELDPAFKDFSAWEYRLVVNCDAPDEILAWGRTMLRNYRPDHIYNPNYGWRYSATVKTEVPYGSQNVKNDVPTLQEYQNIIKDGGVCGRRAFFGRFILRSFGIPTWGVTQHAHAALSHWTPKGWVVNLGAGFEWSWWDKADAPQSGTDFLLETQARALPQEYLKVLRAQWVSRVLGEPAYNDRAHVPGGYWSNMAHYQALAIATASKAVNLGPLGQELAEANEPQEKGDVAQAQATDADCKIVIGQDGMITIPAAAQGQPKGKFAPMKSFSGGLQLHCTGGFQAEYEFAAPHAGKYALAARVVTAQEGQKFLVQANDAKEPVGIAVPYTCGQWQQTPPVELSLVSGRNVLHFALQDGSRGVTIKELTLTPVK